MTDAPPHRPPNTSMTEADWEEAMRLFLNGWSDTALGERYGVSGKTVACQRYRRGVRREHRPRLVIPPPLGEAVGLEGGGPAPVLSPVLVLPDADEPGAFAAALLTHGKALAGAGRMAESAGAVRLARSVLLAARMQAEMGPLLSSGGAFPPWLEEDGALPVLRPAQLPPDEREDGWRTWLFLGGRGAAAGFGPEGGPPRYEPSRRRLLWPNGAVGQLFSAEDVDGLRGPQFEAAWGDELCAWPDAAAALAQVRLGLRLGDDPRLVLTTTPRPSAALRGLLSEPGMAVTRGSALDNAEHLAPGFVEGLRRLYSGTRLERQEIEGEVIEALEGAVFRRVEIERAQALGRAGVPALFERVVVAVDPLAGTAAGRAGSACGIVVAGLLSAQHLEPRLWVLADRTCRGLTVSGWAARVAEAASWADGLGVVSVIAEANQGGEMVRQVLREARVPAPIRLVRARVGKAERAEPVALLYEQGRVAHAAGLAELEDQMLLLGGEGSGAGGSAGGSESPDRADALGWALTALALEPLQGDPSVRVV